MDWYTAHAITYIQLTSQAQSKYHVYENILLIRAASPKEAMRKAAKISEQRCEESRSQGLMSDNMPASMVFAGVRKVVLVEDSDRRPGDGTELTYNEMCLDSPDDVAALAKGRSVRATLDDLVE